MGSAEHYNEVMSSGELLQAFSLLWNCPVSYITSMSLKCAIELGIPDIIHNHGQPVITFSKVIEKLPIHPSKTHCIPRIMRLLVHSGFFVIQRTIEIDQEDREEEAYSLTNVSRLLLTDAPAFTQMKTFYLNPLLPQSMDQWHSLSTWLKKSDRSLCETAYGMTLWDQLAHDPDLSNIFNKAMACTSQLISKVILNSEYYENVFDGLKSLVDVAGGSGTMAKATANKFPHMKCTVFYLPNVISNLQGTDNLSFVGSNMFSDAIPPADAILLKMTLRNRNDEDSIKILKKCREAISSNGKGGKIIVIDIVIGNEKTEELTDLKLCNDVIMMTLSGKERSLMEWEKLILAAKFSHCKITPILGCVSSIIELYP